MKRLIICILIVACFLVIGCDSILNSAIKLKNGEIKGQKSESSSVDSIDLNQLFEYENDEIVDLSEDNKDIDENDENDEMNLQETSQPTQSPAPSERSNIETHSTDNLDIANKVVVATIKDKILDNGNRFIDAVGYDENGKIIINYATAVVFSNLNDGDNENDTMDVIIEAFDGDGNLLWQDKEIFENFISTELGNFSVVLVDNDGNILIENLSYKGLGNLRCLSYKNGDVLWSYDAFSVNIAQAENKYYYFTQYYNGELICLDEEGNKRWAKDFGKGGLYYWPLMTLENNKIIIKCQKQDEEQEQLVTLVYDLNGKLESEIIE